MEEAEGAGLCGEEGGFGVGVVGEFAAGISDGDGFLGDVKHGEVVGGISGDDEAVTGDGEVAGEPEGGVAFAGGGGDDVEVGCAGGDDFAGLGEGAEGVADGGPEFGGEGVAGFVGCLEFRGVGDGGEAGECFIDGAAVPMGEGFLPIGEVVAAEEDFGAEGGDAAVDAE